MTDPEDQFIAAIRAGDLGSLKSMLAAQPGLIEHGADRTLRDDAGFTAGDHARQNGHTTLADRLR